MEAQEAGKAAFDVYHKVPFVATAACWGVPGGTSDHHDGYWLLMVHIDTYSWLIANWGYRHDGYWLAGWLLFMVDHTF